MKLILMIISFAGLALNLLPSFFVFAQTMDWDTYINLMTTGTIMWFFTAPFWMKKKDDD